jgi:hypothetical protein
MLGTAITLIRKEMTDCLLRGVACSTFNKDWFFLRAKWMNERQYMYPHKSMCMSKRLFADPYFSTQDRF